LPSRLFHSAASRYFRKTATESCRFLPPWSVEKTAPGMADGGSRHADEDPNQTDEEIILRDEVSDQALEAASVAPGGFPTLAYGTYCFTWRTSGISVIRAKFSRSAGQRGSCRHTAIRQAFGGASLASTNCPAVALPARARSKSFASMSNCNESCRRQQTASSPPALSSATFAVFQGLRKLAAVRYVHAR
jgi:hypothetical protein